MSGRNTLIAVAVDGAGQTASASAPVTVRRFAPSELGLALSRAAIAPRRTPSASTAAAAPGAVSPSQGCSGTVTITAKRGTKIISTKRATLSRTCEYKATFSFKTRARRACVHCAKFGGNEVPRLDARRRPHRPPGLASRHANRGIERTRRRRGVRPRRRHRPPPARRRRQRHDRRPQRGARAALAEELGASFVATDVTDADPGRGRRHGRRGRRRAAHQRLLRRHRLGREDRGRQRRRTPSSRSRP